MVFGAKKKLFGLGLLLIALVGIPATVFIFKQQQDNRSRADKTVILSYEPSSTQSAPVLVPAGTTFSLDVFVDPGPSAVSYVKAELTYDTTQFEAAGGFIPNQDAFSQVIESSNAPGKVVATLSVGSDTSKALKAKTKIGTLTLKTLTSVPSNATGTISFGPDSQALALSANASFNENVIASTVPAYVKFSSPATTCGTTPSDTMLVIDNSGSMNDRAGSSGTKLSNAKTAANTFVDIVAKDSKNYYGFATYASTASLKSQLGNNASTIKSQINAISANGGTCIECGINKANQEINARKRAGIKNIVVLLTDGRANYVEGTNGEVNVTTAETKALNAAINGHNANGTIFYTIGLGKDVNSTFLTKLAETTGGQYFFSPTTDQLNSIYTQISQILAKGSVSGNVFNDTNANGSRDQGEENLPGAVVQLQSAQTNVSITSDSTGNFLVSYLCDGSYTLKQVLQPGWKQTSPPNQGNYTFNITNGNAVTDKNFGNNKGTRCSDSVDNDGNGFIDSKDSTCHTDGNPANSASYDPQKNGEYGTNTCSDSIDNNGNSLIDGADPVCHTDGDPGKPYDPNLPENALPTPTPTPVPGSAKFDLDIILHGIGAGGDNANPTGNSLSNKEPKHPVQSAFVNIYNVNNELFATASGEVTYDPQMGNYKGTVTTSKLVPAGAYTIKVTVDRHLRRLVPGIQNLNGGATIKLQQIQAIAGDITRDNRLDILDYNLIIDCYSDLAPAPACDDPTKKANSDLNDDDIVGFTDYNLFLRELSTQPGE